MQKLFQAEETSHTFSSKNTDSFYGNHVILVCRVVSNAEAISGRRDVFEY